MSERTDEVSEQKLPGEHGDQADTANQQPSTTDAAAEWRAISGMEENFSRYTAITDPDSGVPVDIDDVIRKLSEREQLEEGESICYIGSGNFAVVRLGNGQPGSFAIKRMIEYEEQRERSAWRAELKYESYFPYRPNPQSLHTLYSSEEIRNMPKFI